MFRALSALGARPMGLPPAPFLLPVRCRKTRHDPPAKSKVGRVATPPAVDPAEFFVLTERYRQYRQTVRALRLEFVSEVRKKVHEARTGVLAERKALEDAAEHRELMAWNQAENQRLRELRMARLRQEAREQERRQAEEEARQAREAQAWVQLKEREVLQLQVGRVSRGWGCRPRTPPVPRVLRAARRRQKTSLPERTWRRGWKKRWTPPRATIGPSPEMGWWSGHSTRAPEGPVRTVSTQGPWG
ncbi:28S ribosomal protein S26, mitochondrial isoform X1 [Delphinapterus leucas]|uniref:Small ribosomal subunit protein mS26 n=1 Tax=Delphinapterus leucas TaxID=9749 RepID=A0A2Y9PZH0_DELLE|nr:28S ribosomal protein S26, mitochondrial isoform X1 [Delphinapterus leucas]